MKKKTTLFEFVRSNTKFLFGILQVCLIVTICSIHWDYGHWDYVNFKELL